MLAGKINLWLTTAPFTAFFIIWAWTDSLSVKELPVKETQKDFSLVRRELLLSAAVTKVLVFTSPETEFEPEATTFPNEVIWSSLSSVLFLSSVDLISLSELEKTGNSFSEQEVSRSDSTFLTPLGLKTVEECKLLLTLLVSISLLYSKASRLA